jgi:hypothetical protein
VITLVALIAAAVAGGARLLDGSAEDGDAFAGELLHTADLCAPACSAADMKRWAAALYGLIGGLCGQCLYPHGQPSRCGKRFHGTMRQPCSIDALQQRVSKCGL